MSFNKIPLTILTSAQSCHIVAPLPPVRAGLLLWNFDKNIWEQAWTSPGSVLVTAVIKGHVESLYSDSSLSRL